MQKFVSKLVLLFIVALATLIVAGNAYGPNGEPTSFCAGFGCRDRTIVATTPVAMPGTPAPIAAAMTASATAIGPGAKAVATAENAGVPDSLVPTIPNNIAVQTETGPNPVAVKATMPVVWDGPTQTPTQVPTQAPVDENPINRYGAVDNGADLLQHNVDTVGTKVDAEMGYKIVKWMQLLASRLGQPTFDCECPADDKLHPLISETAFKQIVRDVGPMSASQFVATMKQGGFLAIGSAGNINMAIVSGPIGPGGLVSYLRMIAFARNPDGSIALIADIPFSPDTKTAEPIPPTIQPKAFAL